MWLIASFNIGGFKTREYDLTPAVGIGLIVLVFYLVGSHTMIGG